MIVINNSKKHIVYTSFKKGNMSKLLIGSSLAGLGAMGGLWIYNGLQNKYKIECVDLNKLLIT